jgi:hypothetical protein
MQWPLSSGTLPASGIAARPNHPHGGTESGK